MSSLTKTMSSQIQNMARKPYGLESPLKRHGGILYIKQITNPERIKQTAEAALTGFFHFNETSFSRKLKRLKTHNKITSIHFS